MDEKTKILVCLGSAVAANCVECFKHYHKEAIKAGMEPAVIETAVKLGSQVKKGAHITVMSVVDAVMSLGDGGQARSCCGPAKTECCSEVK